MTARESAGVQVSGPDIVVLNPVPPAPADPPRLSGPPPSRRRVLLIVCALLAVLALAAVIVAGIVDDDGAVAVPAAEQPAGVPAEPDPLVVRVGEPAAATVGEPVVIDVAYSDGSGIFSGTAEDWGDGVGTSSLREGQCTAAEPAPGPLSDSYRVTHAWTEAGTYTVTLGVHSYACRGTTAVQDQATQTLTVQVLAR